MAASSERPPADGASVATSHGTPIRWIPTALLVVVLTLLGAGAGYLRTPTYASTVDVGVGTAGLSTNSVPGYVQAVQVLAGSYSRTIDSPDVTRGVARQTGFSEAAIAANLTASPVPDSSVIRLDATATAPEAAINLVNTGATVFADVTERRLQSSGTPQVPLSDIEAAETSVLKARRAAQQIKNKKSQRYLEASAAVRARQIRAQALQTQYESTRMSTSVISVEVVRPAVTATSDRRSQFVLFTILGALIGSVLAVGLQMVRVSRAQRLGATG